MAKASVEGSVSGFAGTVLKWGVILVVVYLVWQFVSGWWASYAAANSTSTSLPNPILTSGYGYPPNPWNGYALPGGFNSSGLVPVQGGPFTLAPDQPILNPILTPIGIPKPSPSPVLGNNWWNKILPV